MEEQKNDLQEGIVNEAEGSEITQASGFSGFYNRHKILVWIVGIILAICMVYAMVTPDSSDEVKGIKVLEQRIETSRYYAGIDNYIHPIALIEVENTSSETKEVSVKINFYADGTLLGEGQSSYVTLMPGDKTVLKAQSNKGYYYLYAQDKEYTYKITKWYVY